MADEPADFTLQLLRRMDGKLDRVLDDIHDVKVRLTSVEEGLSGVHRRMDRLEARVDRIERRLDLVEPAR